ncbi:MAG: hypothetical protein GTO55_10140 [Armatimonadetes bacterium]|nr:hypothetical protein [Armatimonadota bacterium]NIM24600.1 hypothetical protein [Armatimonadota bacterium]NIM68476.1 hypothetical protein [Armatimonadota bacterium]NIM76862.1 hypothetical protein [Armatimonadota bacterium]NIN06673.1 hypothetical protein [Armatimonadota bacterium]
MDGTPGKWWDSLWRAACFLAPWLRRLLHHPWFFRLHMLHAALLLILGVEAGLHVQIWLSGKQWWQLICLVPPLVLLMSYWRMHTEKPGIPLFTIQEALASETEGKFHPLGRIAWSQVGDLTKRAEVDAIIERWDKGATALLLTGYSASGKSATAAMVGDTLVKRGSWLLPSFVYYVNLTNQREAPPGAGDKPILECIKETLGKDEPFPGSMVYCIVEDVHHEIEKIGEWNWLLEKPGWRVLLTSRPPEDYVFQGSQASRRKETPFHWLSDEHRAELATDEGIVEAIIRSRERVTWGNLETVLHFISSGPRSKRKEPNLLLLDCALHAAQESKPKMSLEKVCRSEHIRDYLESHWNAFAEKFEIDDKILFSILCPLSVLSEFEVPVSQSFIITALKKEKDEVAKALEALTNARATVRVKTGDVRERDYFLLPHARLARVQRELWVKDDEREGTLAGYIKSEPFIGTLARRLFIEDRDYLKALLRNRGRDVVQRSLEGLPLSEIGWFLQRVARSSKPLAAQVAEKHKQEILGRSLAQASLREIGWFLWGVARASQPLAEQVGQRHEAEIGKVLAQASLSAIGVFLSVVAWARKSLAARVAERHKEEILGRGLAQASPGEIGEFLRGLADASEALAAQAAERHETEIGRRLAQASLNEIEQFLREVVKASEPLATQVAERHETEIGKVLVQANIVEMGRFLGGVARASESLAVQVLQRHETEIGKVLAQANIVEMGEFLGGVARASESLAAQVAERDKTEIGKALAQASLREIGWFLESAAQAFKPSAAQVAQRHKTEIGKALAQASLGGISAFLGAVARASEALPGEVAERHKTEIGEALAQACLGEIGAFLSWGVMFVSEAFAAQVAERHKTEIGEALAQASLREIGWFLWGVAPNSEALAVQVAEKHQTEIGKALAQASLGKICLLFWGLAEACAPLAAEMAERHKEEIREVYQRSSPDERTEFKEWLSDFLLEILGLSEGRA